MRLEIRLLPVTVLEEFEAILFSTLERTSTTTGVYFSLIGLNSNSKPLFVLYIKDKNNTAMSTFLFYDTLIINNYSYIHIIFPIIYQYQTFYYEKYDIVFYLYKLWFLHWQGRIIRPSRWFWSSFFFISKRIDIECWFRDDLYWGPDFVQK